MSNADIEVSVKRFCCRSEQAHFSCIAPCQGAWWQVAGQGQGLEVNAGVCAACGCQSAHFTPRQAPAHSSDSSAQRCGRPAARRRLVVSSAGACRDLFCPRLSVSQLHSILLSAPAGAHRCWVMAARLPQLLAERLLPLIPTRAAVGGRGGLSRLSTLAATAGVAAATAAAANGGPAAVSPLVYP